MLYKYCVMLNNLLLAPEHAGKTIYHYTTHDVHKRSNAAYLISSFAMLYLHKSVEEVARPLQAMSPPLLAFRDASYGSCTYKLSVHDCLQGLNQALLHEYFDFSTFNLAEYEHYEVS